MQHGEFRVKVSIRNNLLLSAVEAAGYVGHGAQARFCNDCGICATTFIQLSTLKTAPLLKTGEFSTAAKALMEFLGCSPNDLWTNDQLVMSLSKNSSTLTTTAAQISEHLAFNHEKAMTLPDPADTAEKTRIQKTVAEIVGTLPIRARQVLALRFGLDGGVEMTLVEAAAVLDVTSERIRQIEAKAIRSLRNHDRLSVLVKG